MTHIDVQDNQVERKTSPGSGAASMSTVWQKKTQS